MDVPDRLSATEQYARDVRVFFNGVEHKNDVKEYCISEGWIIIHLKDRLGRIDRNQSERLQGEVRVEWKPVPKVWFDETAVLEAKRLAAEKRARKAARQAKGMK